MREESGQVHVRAVDVGSPQKYISQQMQRGDVGGALQVFFFPASL